MILASIPAINVPTVVTLRAIHLYCISGTFFPVSNLPQWIRPLALAFPLYHLTELARWFSLGIKEADPIASVAYLILFTLFSTYLALKFMRKRLIK
jgi:lipooligosaccharide transport system permease protein